MLFSNFTEKQELRLARLTMRLRKWVITILAVNIFLWDLFERVAEWLLKCLRKRRNRRKVKDKINEYIGIGVSLPQQAELPLTPRSKRILEMSALEARRLNHSYIGTEHLLMAIIRDGDGVAAKFLNRLVLICRISIRIQSVQ